MLNRSTGKTGDVRDGSVMVCGMREKGGGGWECWVYCCVSAQAKLATSKHQGGKKLTLLSLLMSMLMPVFRSGSS